MFTSSPPPLVRPLEEGDKWKLEEDFAFSWTSADGTLTVERLVPKGFITDGLSIPRVFRGRFSPTGKAFRAAIAHDWLYRECPPLPRDICDAVFLDGMEFCEEGWWNRNVMHKAVRAFGWFKYGRECKDVGVSDARE